MTLAIMPASFDPITLGHVDIASRAEKLFDRLVVAVFAHPRKQVLFTLEERLAMVRESLANLSRVDVVPFEGLVVNLCRQYGADVLVRGLRTVADFEYEYQQATLNRAMLPGLDVVCLYAAPEYGALSSSMVKEIVENGGDISGMVPTPVLAQVQSRSFSQAASQTPGG